ncbi:Fanconi anemia group J protein [Apophysomyces sp. BC1034]|nr:Fanconi anemia group J protein [Apophysomyces sp. BC1034]
MSQQPRELPSVFTDLRTHKDQKDNKTQSILSFGSELDNEGSSLPIAEIPSKKYIMGGVEIEFPFRAYQAQIQMMSKIITALQKTENALLESPTGSGKSLAILCAALAWREHQKKKQQQNIQERIESEKRVWQEMIDEAEKQQPAPAPSTLMKRGMIEDNDFQPVKIRKRSLLLRTPRKVEIEVELDKVGVPQRNPAEQTAEPNLDSLPDPYPKIPKIYVGSRTNLYTYLEIRKSMDINLTGNIVIFDEAHNIEDAARSAGSFEVTDAQLFRLQKELQQVIRRGYVIEMHQAIDYLVSSLLEYIGGQNDNAFTKDDFEVRTCTIHGSKVKEQLNKLEITQHSFHETLLPAYDAVRAHADEMASEKEESRIASAEDPDHQDAHSNTRLSVSNAGLSVLGGLFMVLGFFFEEGKDYAKDYQIAIMKKKHYTTNVAKDNMWQYKLGFWCLNPGVVFRQLSDITHSIVLTSGTLSPLATFASELDAQFKIRLEANHVIDSSQVWVRTIPRGPSNLLFRGVYTEMEKFQYRDEVGNALYDIVQSMPFGILCFVPSYSVLDKMVERWKTTGLYKKIDKQKRIFMEPKGAGKKAFESTLQKFYNHIQAVQELGAVDDSDGALLIAVFRGRASEGIDFSDNYCRAVVALSIPFPHTRNIQVNLKREYNNNKNKLDPMYLSSDDWYRTQAYRAINQALGRCIRHRQDWGRFIKF